MYGVKLFLVNQANPWSKKVSHFEVRPLPLSVRNATEGDVKKNVVL